MEPDSSDDLDKFLKMEGPKVRKKISNQLKQAESLSKKDLRESCAIKTRMKKTSLARNGSKALVITPKEEKILTEAFAFSTFPSSYLEYNSNSSGSTCNRRRGRIANKLRKRRSNKIGGISRKKHQSGMFEIEDKQSFRHRERLDADEILKKLQTSVRCLQNELIDSQRNLKQTKKLIGSRFANHRP